MRRPTWLAGGLALASQVCTLALAMRWLFRAPSGECDIVISNLRLSAGSLQQGFLLASLLFGLAGLALDKKRGYAIGALLLILPIFGLVILIAQSGCD